MTITLASQLLALIMAAAAGTVGCFAVMRRMTLAADAMAHVALPGIGIALALGIHPLFGAATMLFFGATLIWALENRSGVAIETVVGVVFSAALAIGSLISSNEALIESLFGGAGALTPGELGFGLIGAVAVIAFLLSHRHQLVLALVSPEIAQTAGVNLKRLNFLYLQAFALTVALGLRYLGVLLMGSLVIIPAATARRLAGNLTQMLGYAVVGAVLATGLGTGAARVWHLPTGPSIIVAAAGLYVLSLFRPTRASTA